MITVNNKKISLHQYDAEVMSIQTFFGDLTPITYKNSQNSSTKYVRTDVNDDTIVIEFLIEASTYKKVIQNIRALKQVLHHCTIVPDDDITDIGMNDLVYECIMKETSYEFQTRTCALLVLKFSAEIYSSYIITKITENRKTINITGARKTPVSFEIKALNNLENYKLNDFIIKKLTAGKTLIIDSEKCIATVDNSLYTKTDQFYFSSFPWVIGKFDIVADLTNVEILTKYRARW